MEAAPPMVYRIEVEVDGVRRVYAVLASDFVDAARRATELARGKDDRVLNVQPVGELL